MSKNNNGWVKWLVLGVIVVVIVILVCKLFKTEKTYMPSEEEKISRADSVFCVASDLEKTFFDLIPGSKPRHEIKIAFKGDKPDKIFYNFSDTYVDSDVASAVESKAHADYNIYMSERGVSTGAINATFSAAEKDVRISLYTNIKSLINATTGLYFLDMGDFQKIRSYSVEEFAKLYENKGFSCRISK